MYKPERFYAIESYLIEIGNEFRLLETKIKSHEAYNEIENKKNILLISELEKSKNFYEKKLNIIKNENESLRRLVKENAFAIKLLIRNSPK